MASAPFPTERGWKSAAPRSAGVKVMEILGVALGLYGAVTMLGYFVVSGTGGSAVVASAMAFVPLVAVLIGIRWVDRWEPEPRLTLLFALLWGAGVSTVLSYWGNNAVAEAVHRMGLSQFGQMAISSAIGAPVIEEVTKGLGVLLIFLVRKRFFDGPVDGIVYAATVAAGFAFIENILYFMQFQSVLGEVFVGRAIMSPFAHVVFTAMIGLTLGVAARLRSKAAWVALFPLGLLMAIALHGLWNFSALTSAYMFLYLALQIPFFVVMVALVYWLRHHERLIIRRRLGEYAQAGWFSAAEVTMLSSMGERRSARRWAKAHGRKDAMAAFQKKATTLAFQRESVATGRAHSSAAWDQARLLADVAEARRAVYAR